MLPTRAVMHPSNPQFKTNGPLSPSAELQRFFATSQDLHCVVGDNGTIKCVSPAWQTALGYREDELVGKPILDLVHPEDRHDTQTQASKACNGFETRRFENRLRTRDGAYLWFHWVTASDPQNQAFYASARDITDAKKLHYRLAAQVQAINASQAVIEFDLNGKIVTANDRFLKLMGYALDEIVGRHHRIFVDPMHAASDEYAAFWETLRLGRFQSAEYKRFTKRGEAVWMRATYTPVLGPDGRPERIIKFASDITAEKVAELELQAAAETDTLTGLPNRMYLCDHMSRLIDRQRDESQTYYALLFLDFDRFKLVNDTLGHEMGDELLAKIADRLRDVTVQVEGALAQAFPTIARLGGDEFVVLLEGLESPALAEQYADHLLARLSDPYLLNGQKIFSTASIGIADSRQNPACPEDLLRDADTAMYQAKTTGKNRYVVFNPAMRQRLESRVELESDLRSALAQDQFVLMYQPIASVESGQVQSAEALIRWQHPTKGLIPPSDFIPIAEDCGLILPIGQWVLREACSQFVRWQNQHAAHALKTISINLSRIQLALPDLPEKIGRIFDEVGILPSQVRLEITESAVMSDVDAAKALLKRLKELGTQIVMDDFGTGYSSLACLHEFTFDGLKIDRSFINQIDTVRSIAALVQTISSLASNLGVDVVAEGVETMSQLSTLQALECQFVQGYLVGRPVPADQFMQARAIASPGDNAGAA